MAALLSSVLDKTDDVVKYIGECRDLARSVEALDEGVEVLPPDVRESGWKFTVTPENKIRFGLGAVRGVGAGAVASILDARAAGGPFLTLFDFLERVDLKALNKRATEALITAGALDAFGHRAQLCAGLDTAYAEVQARQAEKAAGQGSLFGGSDSGTSNPDPKLLQIPEWDEKVRLTREKEALGFFISGHPLDRFRDVVQAFGPANSSTLGDSLGDAVELACVVTKVARQISRKDSSEWAKITIEDFYGTATVLAFKDTWQANKEVLLGQDAVVLIRGKVSGRERDEEDPPIFLDGAESLEAIPETGRLAVEIEWVGGKRVGDDAFQKAAAILRSHPGSAPVEFAVSPGDASEGCRFRSRSLRVDPQAEVLAELRSLFGKSRVRLVRS